MEIDKFDIFKQLKMFWNFYFKKLNRNDVIEIRLMGIKNKMVYHFFQKFCNENKVYQKNNCQMFIKGNEYNLLEQLFKYEKGYIINNCKVCYSINPRFFNFDECGGGYDYTRKVHIIAFDIEKITHEDLSSFEYTQLLKYCEDLKKVFNSVGLINPMVIMSGAGIHFLYKIIPLKITKGKRVWFKDFIDNLASKHKTKMFHFDALKDFTRVFGIPLSLNLKRKNQVIILENSKTVNDFRIRTKKIKSLPAITLNKMYKLEGDFINEPLVNFLMNFRHVGLQSGGELSRNNYLELQFATLLRDNNMSESDVIEIIEVINRNLNKTIQVSPTRVPDSYRFSKAVINKWSRTCCDRYRVYK